MKKILSIFLVLMLMATMLIGCSKEQPANNTPSTGNNTQTETPSANATGIVKVGLGHITSIGKSRDQNGDTPAMAQ